MDYVSSFSFTRHLLSSDSLISFLASPAVVLPDPANSFEQGLDLFYIEEFPLLLRGRYQGLSTSTFSSPLFGLSFINLSFSLPMTFPLIRSRP